MREGVLIEPPYHRRRTRMTRVRQSRGHSIVRSVDRLGWYMGGETEGRGRGAERVPIDFLSTAAAPAASSSSRRRCRPPRCCRLHRSPRAAVRPSVSISRSPLVGRRSLSLSRAGGQPTNERRRQRIYCSADPSASSSIHVHGSSMGELERRKELWSDPHE